MEHAHKVDVRLVHQVEVSKATQFLLHQLECDNWYVACHHEHLFVYHFTKLGVDRYAACFECTPPMEKGIYHGSKAWSLSLIPLRDAEIPGDKQLAQIRAGLAQLT